MGEFILGEMALEQVGGATAGGTGMMMMQPSVGGGIGNAAAGLGSLTRSITEGAAAILNARTAARAEQDTATLSALGAVNAESLQAFTTAFATHTSDIRRLEQQAATDRAQAIGLQGARQQLGQQTGGFLSQEGNVIFGRNVTERQLGLDELRTELLDRFRTRQLGLEERRLEDEIAGNQLLRQAQQQQLQSQNQLIAAIAGLSNPEQQRNIQTALIQGFMMPTPGQTVVRTPDQSTEFQESINEATRQILANRFAQATGV